MIALASGAGDGHGSAPVSRCDDVPVRARTHRLGRMRRVQTADVLVHDAELVATVDDARREIAGGWVAVTDGVVSALGGPGDPVPEAARTDRRARLPGHPGAGQHPPPPVPEPDPRLRARADRRAVRLAGHALPAVGAAGRGGRLRQRLRRADRAGAGRLHHVDRPPLRAPARRRRPDHRRGRRSPRARRPVPPHPRVDVAVGQGRRAAAGLRRPGRRRDPGRLAAAGGGPPRPLAHGDDPDRAGAVLAVQRLDRR